MFNRHEYCMYDVISMMGGRVRQCILHMELLGMGVGFFFLPVSFT